MNGPMPQSTPLLRDTVLRDEFGRPQAGRIDYAKRCGNSPELIARVAAEYAEAGVWLEIAFLARTQARRAESMFTPPWAAEDVTRRLQPLLDEALDLQDARIAAVSAHVISEARRR